MILVPVVPISGMIIFNHHTVRTVYKYGTGTEEYNIIFIMIRTCLGLRRVQCPVHS
jgi:hypothetical protein